MVGDSRLQSWLIDENDLFSLNKNVEVGRFFFWSILITNIIFGTNIINIVKIQIRNVDIPYAIIEISFPRFIVKSIVGNVIDINNKYCILSRYKKLRKFDKVPFIICKNDEF